MQRVLMTGATGLVGRALCSRLAAAGYEVRAALRTECALPEGVTQRLVVGDIAQVGDWDAALAGVGLVVHAAARTHNFDSERAAERYAEANVSATRRLAQAAAARGIQRFIYVSSIKVNGEDSGAGTFTAADVPQPQDAYGRSKLGGEQAVAQAAADGGMSYAIVRPPLVYGPGVRANFLRLMRWVDRSWPLPFAAVANRRSLVNVWNLADLIERLLTHPADTRGVWLVSDGEDCSTPGLIQHLGRALGRPVRLFAVPVPLLRVAATLAARSREAARLCDSLAVDIGATRAALGWRPPVSLDEGLARTADWFRTRAGA